jgi:uncharacterized protein (TIGR03435 family)
MRTVAMGLLVWPVCVCLGQGVSGSPTFEVASVKPSQHAVGKDANRQIVFGPAGISGRNVTLKQLIVEAYRLQPHQVAGGPGWLDVAEYDVEAKAGGPAATDQLALMLRALLADRFRLAVHTETRELRVYELVADKQGPRIHPAKDAESPTLGTAGGGLQFRGDLQHFANLLAIQLTIPVIDDPARPSIASGPPVPVLDKTGLTGIYDIRVDLKPEPGGDVFTLWQGVLRDQLGLKIESAKERVEVLVVDSAERIPTAN